MKRKEKEIKTKVDYYPERQNDSKIVIQFRESKGYYTAHWFTKEELDALVDQINQIKVKLNG